jgi:Kdo2-lipid IVA lauroyltransferase/acyltransferase
MNDDAPDPSQYPLPERRSNRPVTFAHRVQFVVFSILMGFFRLLGIDRASALCGRTMRFVGPKIRPLSRRGEDNLRMIFPDWPEEKIHATITDVWENLGRTAAEYAHLDRLHIDGDNPRIVCADAEKVAKVFETHSRMVFVTGHFANWEVTGITAKQMNVPFGVVYRALDNPLIDEVIINKRAAVATRRQIPKGMAGARPMIDLLKDNYSIAFLADQKLNTGGINVPFMGRMAMTAPAAARLAVRLNLPVIPISNERLNGAYFKVTNHDPIAFEPTGDLPADVEALTIKINEFLERDIRARPEQWLWLHRRWGKLADSTDKNPKI